MKTFNDYLEGLQVKGLYDIQVGDQIETGMEGTRHKNTTTVTKVTNDKVYDNSGNIFHKSGKLFKSTYYNIKSRLKVYAYPKTQSRMDKEYKTQKIRFIRDLKWEEFDIEQIEKILEVIKTELKWEQGNKLQISRFSEK